LINVSLQNSQVHGTSKTRRVCAGRGFARHPRNCQTSSGLKIEWATAVNNRDSRSQPAARTTSASFSEEFCYVFTAVFPETFSDC
jgi:hypothetical protein